MCRAPEAWAWWPAVGAPFERGVRPHLVRDHRSLGGAWRHSGGAEALRQAHWWYRASAQGAKTLHGALRLAMKPRLSGRREKLCLMVLLGLRVQLFDDAALDG